MVLKANSKDCERKEQVVKGREGACTVCRHEDIHKHLYFAPRRPPAVQASYTN